jgi:hypothetical protein
MAWNGNPELDSLLAQSERMQAENLSAAIGAAMKRLITLAIANSKPEHDELIDVKAASAMTGMSESYLYHAKRLPFVVKVGRRRMFSRRGIQKFIAKQQDKA